MAPRTRLEPPRGVVPLLLFSGVVVLVAIGLGRGIWLPNLHNGLLALAFTGVGAYVLFQRPWHVEGVLFTATGVVEAVMFVGRQLGHSPGSTGDRWWGWLGVWPLALGLALTTVSVVLFPDGRLPSRRWRWVIAVVVAVATACSALSALWPVEYAAAGVAVEHPFALGGLDAASAVWSHVAHPAYAAFQLLWVVVVVQRWRETGGPVRQQLAVVLVAAAVSVAALLVGLVGWDSPRAGLLSAPLVPIAAGWAIVHAQNVAAYSALSWLSRPGPAAEDLPTRVARAVSEALSAPATLWMGGEDRLVAVGVWPETGAELEATTLSCLQGSTTRQVRPVCRSETVVGALSVERRPATSSRSPRPSCWATWPPRRRWWSSTSRWPSWSPDSRWTGTSTG